MSRESKKAGKNLIFGAHVIAEWLNEQHARIQELIIAANPNPRVAGLVAKATALGIPVTTIGAQALRGMAGPRNPQGIAARVLPFEFADLDTVLDGVESPVVLALDGVTDPANLGAIIRSASFFAITAVVLPHDKSASITPVVEKTAAGGLAHVSVCQVNSLVRTLTNLQERGFSVLGTIPGPHPEPSSLDIKGPLVVVVGSEGKGIRPSVRRLCDLKTSLRYREQGTRSLNVASFTSIILYELFRP